MPKDLATLQGLADNPPLPYAVWREERRADVIAYVFGGLASDIANITDGLTLLASAASHRGRACALAARSPMP
ncbi:MAG TPA: hypothetical protein VLG10_01760 [Methylomirabilota bacterium]|nr:hypothetical protein [Methylomirabilota bacterium]